MLNKLSVTDINPDGKRVFVRVDFNVPLDDKLNVTDDLRIRAALKTIEYLLEKNASVILCSHLGRPKGKVVPEMSLKPVASRLEQLIKRNVIMAPDCIGPEVEKMVKGLKSGEILMLENVRFHKGETDNDPGFAKKLADLCDIYVNDAFGAAHRAHASTEGITKYVDISAAGFLMQKEIEYLANAILKPKRPFVAILGGAKVSTKIDVIKNLLNKCDSILLGGAMVYTFEAVKGIDTGSSLIEKESFDTAREILESLKKRETEFSLPVDHVIANEISETAETKVIDSGVNFPAGWIGVDIGPRTIEKYKKIIKEAGTIVWNGPMGVFETSKFAKGTVEIANAVAESDAISVIGGGDSASAVKKAGVGDRMTHISTGGGASLELLAGLDLPGVIALTDKK